PLTLSSVGTVIDEDGHDVLPFYFPWNEDDNTVYEPYYIVVESALEVVQFERENYPFDPNSETPDTSLLSFNNIVLNNVFWRAGNKNAVVNSTTGTIST